MIAVDKVMVQLLREGRLRGKRGAITVLMLVMLIFFGVLITATLAFIARQSAETTRRTRELQAFNVADSGVEYAAWLVTPLGGGKDPSQLTNLEAWPVSNARGQPVGTVDLTFSYVADTKMLRVRAVGRTHALPALCQAVEADIKDTRAQGTGSYEVVAWHHVPGRSCR